MPRSNLLKLECEFCGNSDTFDQVNNDLKKVHKWINVSRADDRQVPGVDTSRWYDCLDCVVSGEERLERLSAVNLPSMPELVKQ
jgi:hypothetical protein